MPLTARRIRRSRHVVVGPAKALASVGADQHPNRWRQLATTHDGHVQNRR